MLNDTDPTNRYACSLYVDLRLGIKGCRALSREDAYDETAKVYGNDAAEYARKECN